MFLTVIGWILFGVTTILLIGGVGGYVTRNQCRDEVRRALGLPYEEFAFDRFIVMLSVWVASGWYIFDYVS